MSLLTSAILLLAISQNASPRHPDEAIVETVAMRHLLDIDPKERGRYVVAIRPEYWGSERKDLFSEVDTVIKSTNTSEADKKQLRAMRDSIGSVDWQAAKLRPIREMSLASELIVTSASRAPRDLRVLDRSGKPKTVRKYLRFDPPSYSRDGKWAVVHPHSVILDRGSANFYEGTFLRRTDTGWKIAFDVSVYML